MKKGIVFILAAVLIAGLFGCGMEPANDKTTYAIKVAENDNPKLQKSVVPLKSHATSLGDVNVKVVGASFDKATGDVIGDTVMGGGLRNESFDDSAARGFAIGFVNTSNSDAGNMDAYLALYLKYEFEGATPSQRNSIMPELSVSITDDQGQELIQIYNSIEDKYIDVTYPYSVLLFKTFSDSKSFDIEINGQEYTLKTKILK